MKRTWGLAFATCMLLVAASAPAHAAVITTCPGGPPGPFVVATAAAAQAIADGYNNGNCDVIINTSIVPGVAVFRILARSITIQGPDVLGPPLVGIVNPFL